MLCEHEAKANGIARLICASIRGGQVEAQAASVCDTVRGYLEKIA